jgi:hypothetical protein
LLRDLLIELADLKIALRDARDERELGRSPIHFGCTITRVGRLQVFADLSPDIQLPRESGAERFRFAGGGRFLVISFAASNGIGR